MMTDKFGTVLRDGVSVRLLSAPPDLLSGLPLEDQKAIKWAASDIIKLKFIGADDYGNAELEFRDPGGCMHWIFVKPTDIAAMA